MTRRGLEPRTFRFRDVPRGNVGSAAVSSLHLCVMQWSASQLERSAPLVLCVLSPKLWCLALKSPASTKCLWRLEKSISCSNLLRSLTKLKLLWPGAYMDVITMQVLLLHLISSARASRAVGSSDAEVVILLWGMVSSMRMAVPPPSVALTLSWRYRV